MKRWLALLAYALFVVAIVGTLGWWEHGIWVECRAGGHSISYCLRMVTR